MTLFAAGGLLSNRLKAIMALCVAVTAAAFAAFIYLNEDRVLSRAENQIQDHADVVSSSLWTYEKAGPTAYLSLAAVANDYERIKIRQTDGRLFLDISGPRLSGIEVFLRRIGLIPRIHLHANITHGSQIIGEIHAIWHAKTVFIYLYALVCALLMLFGVGLYLSLVEANQNLDARVRARTAELEKEVTERKRAEEKLREYSERLTLHVQNTPLGVIEWDLDFRVAGWNKAAERIFGFSQQEAMGRTAIELILPESELAHIGRIWEQLSTNTGGYQSTNRNLTKNGDIRICEWHNTTLTDADGRIIGIASLVLDITDRKRGEDELNRLRHYLTNIIDSMPSVIVGVDAEGRVTQWNWQAEKETGLRAEAAIGRPYTEVLPRLTQEVRKVETAIRKRRSQRDAKLPSSLDGGTRYEDVTIYPLISNGVEGAVIRLDDVTERVRIEEMMIQSEKMLSVGGLAAGMAHEINNPLAGIMQTANVMSDRLSQDLPANLQAAQAAGTTMTAIRAFMEAREIPRMMTTIIESGRRAAAVVDNMLSFARKSDRVVSSHDMAELLDRTVVLAATHYDLKKQYDFKKIHIERDYEAGLPKVPCEHQKIQQVFLNVLRNGAEAMCSRSQTAPAGSAPPPRLTLRLRSENRMIRIEIEDNGPGMTEDVRRRVFEPFFTTKPPGVGTGLGLSVSYFIITENHGGRMSVESTHGQGTRFIMRLPVEQGTP